MYVNPRQPFTERFTPIHRLETFASLAEAKQSSDNVEKWTKPEPAPPFYSLTSLKVRKEAKGAVLISVPYNYPILLLMSPLVSVITRVRCLPILTRSPGWRYYSWKCRLHKDFGASSCYEFPSSRAVPSVSRSGPISSGNR